MRQGIDRSTDGLRYRDLFALEHSRAAYRADFAIYGVVVLALAVFLVATTPRETWLSNAVLGVSGLVGWSAIEYALHRFVLHGLQPFRRWHEAHHERPTALICAPTILTAALFVALVFLPSLWLSDLRRACALTLGIVAGYGVYAIVHHATHHWRADGAWLRERKRWHAMHHHDTPAVRCFGVTSGFWDRVFASAGSIGNGRS